MSQLQVTGEAKIRDIQGPVVSNSGVITALDGAASQYVRGDGTLADFPTSTGGGSSVSYYLNSSVSQGTIGGVAYRELSKEPIIGAGTDIAISANGYVANYLTDANDPDVLSIPGGNFNCEFYFSVNNNTGNPTTYAELYKYDGTTFTLLGTSAGVPESINQGTTIAPYYFAIPVATAALALTDRLAIRIYVNVSGRTVTLHTENGHLCQVVTTLSKGMVSLNNLTDQSQFLTTGTAGTNFAIASSGDTHTFNLPVASATNTGKLSSTDWSTFNGKVPYTGAIANVDLGLYEISAQNAFLNGVSGINGGNLFLRQDIDFGQSAGYTTLYSSGKNLGFVSYVGSYTYNALFSLNSLTNNSTRTFTLPDLSGTLVLLEGSQTFSGSKTFSATTLVNTIYIDGVSYLKNLTTTSYITGYTTYSAKANGVIEYFFPSSFKSVLDFNDAADYTYTFPAASGTIALTSNLSSYVPYTGATGTVNIGIYTLNAGNIDANGISTSGGAIRLKQNGIINTGPVGYTTLSSAGAGLLDIYFGDTNLYSVELTNNLLTANRVYNFPNASGTIALLSGTQTFTGDTTFSNDLLVNGVRVGIGSGGSNNARFGALSFMSNTTGGYNTAIGTYTLNANTTGSNNTALGNVSLTLNTTGSNNTAIGGSALANITTGSSNIGLGNSSGGSITTGSNNTIIGNYAGTAAMSNNIVLADGQGNIRYQWNGTDNVFGNPISGTSATFSSTMFVNSPLNNTVITTSDATNITNGFNLLGSSSYWGIRTATSGNFNIDVFGGGVPKNALSIAQSTGAATFSSVVNANDFSIAASGGYKVQTNASGVLGYMIRSGTWKGTTENNLAFATDGAYGISFFTNGSTSERMLITSGGNVGIGTSSPQSLLEVRGATPFIRITDNSATSETGLIMDNSGGFIRGGLTINHSTGEYKSYCGVSGNSYFQTFYTNGTERMRITSGGLMLLGATSSYTDYGLIQITGDNKGIAIRDSDGFYRAIYNQSGTLYFYNGSNEGYLNSAGAWVNASDISIKKDVKDLQYGLKEVLNLKPKSYKMIDNDLAQIGFIAQEVGEILPELVDESKKGMKGLSYGQMTAVLVKAIQEQTQIIKDLEARIKQLENK